MQTISFLLFRLLAFVVKNHLKREKNSKKKKSFFPFTTTPSPGYPPDPDPDPHEDFCPDPDPDPQKKCGSKTLFSSLIQKVVPKVEHVNSVILYQGRKSFFSSCYEFIVFCLTVHQEPEPEPAPEPFYF